MVVEELGSALVGIVFGWILVKTVATDGWDWKAYDSVLAALVGGAGIDYLLKTSTAGYFWIGIFIGFFADNAIRFATNPKADPQHGGPLKAD